MASEDAMATPLLLIVIIVVIISCVGACCIDIDTDTRTPIDIALKRRGSSIDVTNDHIASALYTKFNVAGRSIDDVADSVAINHLRLKIRREKKEREAKGKVPSVFLREVDTIRITDTVRVSDTVNTATIDTLRITDTVSTSKTITKTDTVRFIDTLRVAGDTIVDCGHRPVPKQTYKRITDDVYLMYYGAEVKSVLDAIEEIKTNTGKLEYDVEDTDLTDGIVIKMAF